MSDIPVLPPPSQQTIVLNSIFNSAMATGLLLGIYTVIYLGTMYIYLTKKRSQHYMVISAITAMYIITLAQSSVQWAEVKLDLVNDDSSRVTSFIASFAEPAWQTLFNDFCGLFTSVLADGLLIWRCYNVWDGSYRVIAASLILMCIETTMYIASIVLLLVLKLNPTTLKQITMLNGLISAALFTTASTTGLTASLIAYRILSLSRHDPHSRAKKTFNKLLDVLVQSAAAYAIVSIWYAIFEVIPEKMGNLAILSAIGDYLFYIFPITAGVASTSMVARVALLSASDAARSGLAPSGIEFRGESTGSETAEISGVNHLYIIGGNEKSEQEQKGDHSKESDLARV